MKKVIVVFCLFSFLSFIYQPGANSFFCWITILEHKINGQIVVLLSDYHGTKSGTKEVVDQQQQELLSVFKDLITRGKQVFVIVEDDFSQRLRSEYASDLSADMHELYHISKQYQKNTPLWSLELLCKENGIPVSNVEFRKIFPIPDETMALRESANRVLEVKFPGYAHLSQKNKDTLIINEMILKLIKQNVGQNIIFVCAGGYHVSCIKKTLEHSQQWNFAWRTHSDRISEDRIKAFENFEDFKSAAPANINEKHDAILNLKQQLWKEIYYRIMKGIMT